MSEEIKQPQNASDTNSSAPVDTEQADEQLAKEKAFADSMRAVVMGEVMNEWPQDLFIPPDALEVVLDSFEGPLDLLLYLIKKQNLDILNIPVADITL